MPDLEVKHFFVCLYYFCKAVGEEGGHAPDGFALLVIKGDGAGSFGKGIILAPVDTVKGKILLQINCQGQRMIGGAFLHQVFKGDGEDSGHLVMIGLNGLPVLHQDLTDKAVDGPMVVDKVVNLSKDIDLMGLELQFLTGFTDSCLLQTFTSLYRPTWKGDISWLGNGFTAYLVEDMPFPSDFDEGEKDTVNFFLAQGLGLVVGKNLFHGTYCFLGNQFLFPILQKFWP